MNEYRPLWKSLGESIITTDHSSLDYLIPAEFARRYYEENQIKGVKQPLEKVGSLSF